MNPDKSMTNFSSHTPMIGECMKADRLRVIASIKGVMAKHCRAITQNTNYCLLMILWGNIFKFSQWLYPASFSGGVTAYFVYSLLNLLS